MAKKRQSKSQRRPKRTQHHVQQDQIVSNITNNNDDHSQEEEQQQEHRPRRENSTMFDRLFLQQNHDDPFPEQQYNLPYTNTNDPSSSMLDYARRMNRKQGKTRIDPITCSYDILIARIFSFLTKKKDCLIAMRVSKLWMERVPIYTKHVWKTIKLNGSKKQHGNSSSFLKDALLHQCLGPHVKSVTFSHFHQHDQQQQMLKILQILHHRQCTQLNELRFKLCNIKDQLTFLDYLIPLVSKITKLSFEEYFESVFPIQSMIISCPNLEHFDFTLISLEKRQKLERQKKKQSPSIDKSNNLEIASGSTVVETPVKTPEINTIVFNLTDLKLGFYSNVLEIQHRSTTVPFYCSGPDLARIIKQSPQLKTVFLSRTGDNLDPVVIHAIAQLPCLSELGLCYELEENQKEKSQLQQSEMADDDENRNKKRFQQDGALYNLLSKHAKMDLSSPLRILSLNVADDTIMNLICRIFLQEIGITDGFSMVTPDGILRFAETIYRRGTLTSLTLGWFDLRPSAILEHFSRLLSLRIIDFSDCYVEKKSYDRFLSDSIYLQGVGQPMYNMHGQGKLLEISPLCDHEGNRLPFALFHIDDLPPNKFLRRDKRNPYVVVTADTQEQIEHYKYMQSSMTIEIQ